MMTPREPEALRVAFEVLDLLQELGCRHQLGGSYASSIHGIPRQTHDVDVIVELEPLHADALAERLGDRFYLDADAIRSAIEKGRPCNLIHLGSGVKIDLFPKGDQPFDELELARSQVIELGDPPRPTPVKSAEDSVLRKLDWFRREGEVSDRQWFDILAVLRTQDDRLDREYMRAQAETLGVADLLSSSVGEIST
ncbi:MAG: hypothetical protein WBH85_11675 [Thermoanaerobaculia bacterium]